MVLKKWFKEKQPEPPEPTDAIDDVLVHRLALRLRGSFDLDEILQWLVDQLGRQLHLDHCLAYLCDPTSDILRWRAGYHRPQLPPLRWPLRQSDSPELFAQLQEGKIIRIDDPTKNPLVAANRPTFESANIHTLIFVPALSERLEAVLILTTVARSRQLTAQEQRILETVAVQVALAAHQMTLSSALRQAGSQAQSATAQLQAENQFLHQLTQLLLLPSGDLGQFLNHISESLAQLYGVRVCSIEEIQGDMATVRSMHLAGRTTHLGVFPIERTPRQQVLQSAQHSVCLQAAEVYPEDQFLRENELDFYAGVPIVDRTGNVVGLLNLFHREPITLEKRDVKFLTAIARRIGFELENVLSARSLQEMEQLARQRLDEVTRRQEQMKLLQEAQELLRQADSLDAGLEELVRLANHHLASDFAVLARFDEQRQITSLTAAGIESAVLEAMKTLPPDRGLMGLLLDRDDPVRSDNVAHHPRFTGFPPNHPVVRSFLGTSLRARGALIGALYFADKRGGEPFSEQDEFFVRQLATLIALAAAAPAGIVSVAPAFSGDRPMDVGSFPAPEMERPPSGWDVFSHLFTLMERDASIEQIGEVVVEKLMEPWSTAAAGLWVLDSSHQQLIHIVGRGAPIERLAKRGPIPLGEGAIGRSAISGEPLIIEDVHRSEGVPPEVQSLIDEEDHLVAALIVPLKALDKSLGLLVLFTDEARATEKDYQSFIEVLAYCVGSFIEQSRMREAVSRRHEEMAMVQSVIESAGEITSMEHVWDQLLQRLTESLEASHAALFLLQPEGHQLRLFGHRGLNGALADQGRQLALDQVEESIAGLDRGEPIIVAELETDPRIRHRRLVELLQAEGIRSGVILPLGKGEPHATGMTGLLVLGSREPGHFSHYSMEFFSILAHRIAGTVERLERLDESTPRASPDRAAGDVSPWLLRLHETLLEHLTTGVVAVDQDGRMTLFNPAMERLTGYQRSEALGQRLGPNGLSLFLRSDPFEEALAECKTVTRKEAQIHTKSGGRKYVSLTVTPLTDERGTLMGAVGVFTDVTAIRALEHERYRLTPLALIGEMSARLAHEIKNPLASMMSGLELLQRRLQYGEREARYFERLIAELRRLDTTVREMLAYSRTAPPTLAPTDPVEPVEHALETLMPQLEAAHIAVRRDFQLPLEPVLIDANQMEQVFLNLILNAIQAMPDGGTLRVSAREKPPAEDEVTPPAPSDASLVTLEYVVSDTGVGIPPDIIGKIFDPFFSTKTHGTGLGLASVKKIIQAHQGTIDVQSQPGEGATFIIRLNAQRPQ